MYAILSVVLSAILGSTGNLDVRRSERKSVDHLIRHNFQKPIFDPDNGDGRSFEQDTPRIDRFAKAMKEDTSADGYIIAYGGLVSYKNEARIRLHCIRNYLVNTHAISRSRLKLIDGGFRVEVTVQLFLVKAGDPKPTPFPLVNREAVRIRKAPKHPCGKPVKDAKKVSAPTS